MVFFLRFSEGTDEESLLKKVVECCYLGDNKWEYMRTRFDKSYPNAWSTYEKVHIKNLLRFPNIQAPQKYDLFSMEFLGFREHKGQHHRK